MGCICSSPSGKGGGEGAEAGLASHDGNAQQRRGSAMMKALEQPTESGAVEIEERLFVEDHDLHIV